MTQMHVGQAGAKIRVILFGDRVISSVIIFSAWLFSAAVITGRGGGLVGEWAREEGRVLTAYTPSITCAICRPMPVAHGPRPAR